MLKLSKFSPISFLKKYNCIKCHNFKIGNNRIPSLYDISMKYKINKNTKKFLFKKIKFGGTGNWGNEIMPKNKIKNSLIKLIVKWILKIKLI